MQGIIKKIDFLMPKLSQYGVLHHFTQKFYEAFKRAGYSCRLLEGDDCILVPFNDPPDLTICFNGAPKDELGNYLCDILKIPHISCLIDPPFRFLDLTKGDFMTLTCDDLFCTNMLHMINFPRAFFMPHAIESDITVDPKQKRIYDVAMLASFIDFHGRLEGWKKNYPVPVCDAMIEACEITLSDEKTSFILALQQALHSHLTVEKTSIKLDPVKMQIVFEEVELYIKGRDRVELIQSVKDAEVHIFGTTVDKLNWKDYFKNTPNVVVHPGVNYSEALNIMKQSKIVLNSSIKNKEGAHERIFMGLACGALVVTNENSYIKSQFDTHEGLVLYKRSNFEDVNSQINDYLSDERSRQREVERGRQKVLLHHTWDRRVKDLMVEIEPFVKHMKNH